ncbi:MAG: 50S ribosomal protein L9 [Candidatus Harrisonbacteria bacterium CG10_big_fil_rev_8_21_14_0_10_45_28]|uniref:Large ribosomal subunit protein bL9 n=1 Tax=Candidatus Harrisonbacteria bacterium CG10_big_fil_rev_8_21_14_0_10_45_28 TaxID=1974586 RepID=A0A2H0UNU8_9BACT|nr:MAG: 50S ribosomal protein L9 [Candidatus Harrisonbacteria bacterium CG10_big_fil_rev_8_21_14_0_10_45_28]
MKVLLLQDVKGIGRKNQVIDAKDGYARNFLLPKRLAVIFKGQAVAVKAQIDAGAKAVLESAKENARKLKSQQIVFAVKVGGKGEVFGGVSAMMIEERLKALGMSEAKVELAHNFKELGQHKTSVNFGHGVKGEAAVVLEKE